MSTETTEEVISAETPAVAEQVETTETQQAPAWFSHLNAENEEQALLKIEHYRNLEQGYEETQRLKTEFEQKLSLFASVEKDPDPELYALENFKAKGIPLKLATQIVDATREELQNNPLEALILAEAVKNPEKFKQMGRAGIEQALRETYNLEESGEYTATARMKSDAFDAIIAIEKTKSEVGEIKNPINIAKENSKKAQEAFTQKQTLALAEFEKAAGEIKEVSVKDGDNVLSLKVTREDIEKALAGQKDYLGAAFDVSTKEGRQQQYDHIKDQVLFSKVKSGELLAEWRKAHAADVERAATNQVLNGTVKSINRAEAQPGTKEESPAAKYAREKGLPIPAEHRNIQPKTI